MRIVSTTQNTVEAEELAWLAEAWEHWSRGVVRDEGQDEGQDRTRRFDGKNRYSCEGDIELRTYFEGINVMLQDLRAAWRLGSFSPLRPLRTDVIESGGAREPRGRCAGEDSREHQDRAEIAART